MSGLPDPTRQDIPTPVGTGFMVSKDGWFVTAAHLVADDNGGFRHSARLLKETSVLGESAPLLQWPHI